MDVVTQYGYRVLTTEVLVDRPGRFVAKVTTDRGALAVKIDPGPNAFTPELAAIARLGAAGLPVPVVVESGHDHLLIAWIDGEPLSSSSPRAAQHRVGQLLRRVHALPAGPPYAGNDTMDAWIAGWLNQALPWWEAYATPARIASVWDWFHEIRPVLARRGGQTMLFDGRPEHFITRGDDVVGMIDLHDVCAGDAAMDLAVLAVSDPDLLAGVMSGYAPTPTEQVAFDVLIPFYVFLRRLAGAQWQLGYGDPRETSKLLALIDREPQP